MCVVWVFGVVLGAIDARSAARFFMSFVDAFVRSGGRRLLVDGRGGGRRETHCGSSELGEHAVAWGRAKLRGSLTRPNQRHFR